MTESKTQDTMYEYEKYIATPEKFREILNKFGVAIIPRVINEEQCANTISKKWDYFEHISQTWEVPINRNDKKSWKSFWKLFPKHSMLHQHFGVGHTQAVWDLRQNPDIVNIFAKFWDVEPEDLLVSFDGFSFHPPPEVTGRGHYRGNTWYHTDQSFLRPDFECVQTWVTAEDVEEGDATLAFYEGSNKYHAEFEKIFETKDKSDWHKLTPDQEQFYIEKGCQEKRIKCPKGSLVAWDSRTIHCGSESFKNRKKKKWRSVVYLCYQPRSLAKEAMLKKKRKALNDLRTTSHWPAKPKLFAKNPRTYGGELPEITPIKPPVLTDLGIRLAGF